MVLNGQCAFSFQKIYKLGFMELFRTKIPQIRPILKLDNSIFFFFQYFIGELGRGTVLRKWGKGTAKLSFSLSCGVRSQLSSKSSLPSGRP